MQRWGIGQWLSLLLGMVGLAVAACFAALWGWVGDGPKEFANSMLDLMLAAGMTRSDFFFAVGKVIGVLGTAISGSLALLRLWHFAERNLPARLQDYVERFSRDHLQQRQELVGAAMAGQLEIPKTIDASDTVYFRELVSRFIGGSAKSRAEMTAASADRFGALAAMLGKAAESARQRQITSRVIRGYDLELRGRVDDAIVEFHKAMSVDRTDIYSRDVAAGFARRAGDRAREEAILRELLAVSGEVGNRLMQANALRRLAEIYRQGGDRASLLRARDELRDAIELLPPDNLEFEERFEAGRCRTLYCAIQLAKGTPGNLRGDNQPGGLMVALLRDIPDQFRVTEKGGEAYGAQRARRLYDQVADASLDDGNRAPDKGDA